MAKSSYCYQAKKLKQPDKYENVRFAITNAFCDAKETYGYRRIHFVMKANNIILSEKVIRRLMKEENLIVKRVKKKKYNSYQGEITNIIKRDFHADAPNQKWLTDITEFSIPAGKIYLSPIIDCFDGLPVSWSVGRSPVYGKP